MDDGTDATDMAQLAIFIRGIDDECNVIEEMASLVPLKDTTSPGWCGSVDWVLACETKGHQFDFQSEHVPGLWARSPAGGELEATIHWYFFPFSLNINK